MASLGSTTGTPVVLTIAGFDPSSGAGITADLRVIGSLGCYGMACITALTVQNPSEMDRTEPVSAQLVTQTLEKLVRTADFAAIKVGMLGTSQIGTAVADFLADHRSPKVVLDPIIRSSSGFELTDQGGQEIGRAHV